jgi:hypothetical protein
MGGASNTSCDGDIYQQTTILVGKPERDSLGRFWVYKMSIIIYVKQMGYKHVFSIKLAQARKRER